MRTSVYMWLNRKNFRQYWEDPPNRKSLGYSDFGGPPLRSPDPRPLWEAAGRLTRRLSRASSKMPPSTPVGHPPDCGRILKDYTGKVAGKCRKPEKPRSYSPGSPALLLLIGASPLPLTHPGLLVVLRGGIAMGGWHFQEELAMVTFAANRPDHVATGGGHFVLNVDRAYSVGIRRPEW